MTSCSTSRVIIGTLLALLCLYTGYARASAAIVLFSHGEVHASNAGHRHALAKGDDILSGDTITTGQSGRIQMRFSDGGLVSLMPGSTFVVKTYQQPGNNSEGSLVFKLVKGGLRTLSGTIGHKNHANYKLKTRVATLGIRGTQYIATKDGDAMRTHVGQGRVELYNDKGSQILDRGENGIVRPGQAPQKTAMAPHYISAVEDGSSPDPSPSDQNKDKTYSYRDLEGTGLARTVGDSYGLDKPPPRNIYGPGPESGVTSGGDATPANPSFAVAYRPDGGAPVRSESYNQQQWQQAIQADGGTVSGNVPDFLPAKPDTPIADIQPNPPEIHRTGNLVWGEVLTNSNASGSWSYHQPYVWGIPTANVPISGTLNYSLAAATAVRVTDGNTTSTGTLNKFDMSIALNGTAAPSFTADMEVENGNVTWFPSTVAPSSGTLNGAAFKFDSNFNFSGCTGCSLHVAGFLSGNNAEQAGVVYKILINDNNLSNGVVTGGAVLHQ